MPQSRAPNVSECLLLRRGTLYEARELRQRDALIELSGVSLFSTQLAMTLIHGARGAGDLELN